MTYVAESRRPCSGGLARAVIVDEASVELALVRKSLLLMRQASLISAKTLCFERIVRKRKRIVREMELLVSFPSLVAAGSHFTKE
jgi:hypothetical protein